MPTSDTRGKQLRRGLLIALKVAISTGLLTYLALHIGLDTAFGTVRHADATLFALSFVLSAALQAPAIVRWRLLGRMVGFNDSLGRYSAFYLVGVFMNLFLPGTVGGDLGRSYLLAGDRRRWPRALMTVLADRASGMTALMLIGAIAALTAHGVVMPGWIILVSVGGTAALVLGLLLPLVWPWPLQRLKIPLDYWQQPGVFLRTMGLSFAIQGGVVGVNILIGLALGLQIPLGYYFVFTPLVMIAAMVPLSLNGLGIREGAYVYFLTQAGVDKPAALAFGLLWLVLLVILGGLGGLAWIALGDRLRAVKHEIED